MSSPGPGLCRNKGVIAHNLPQNIRISSPERFFPSSKAVFFQDPRPRARRCTGPDAMPPRTGGPQTRLSDAGTPPDGRGHAILFLPLPFSQSRTIAFSQSRTIAFSQSRTVAFLQSRTVAFLRKSASPPSPLPAPGSRLSVRREITFHPFGASGGPAVFRALILR